MPIFGSSRATSKPGASDSTTNAEIPPCPASGSVFANTVYRPATPAFVMNRFDPSRTYSSPSRRAVVRIAAESEPEPASVSAYAHEPLARSRASAGSAPSAPRVPASLSPSEPSSCTARISPLVAQTFDTSSIAIRASSVPVPVPALLLVEQEAEDALLAIELDDVPRELVRLVDLRRTRRDPLARQRAHEVAELPLLVGEDVLGHAIESTEQRLWQTASTLLPSGSRTNAP